MSRRPDKWSNAPRVRPALRRVVFTDRAGASVAVLRDCWLRGIDLPSEPRDAYRGAGRPLLWDDPAPN